MFKRNVSSPSSEQRGYASCLLHAGFFPGIFAHPQNAGDLLLPSVCGLSTDYTALYFFEIELLIITAVRSSNPTKSYTSFSFFS
jgi:hypothetical protein